MGKLSSAGIGILLAAALLGCQGGGLDFKIRFEQIEGLKTGDGIIFEANRIGAVRKVVYTRDGDYLVEAAVEKDFANAVTREARFYISDDPQAAGGKVVEIVSATPGGTLLRDGETVVGSAKPTILEQFLGNLQEDVRRYRGEMAQDLEKFKDGLRRRSLELEEGLERSLDDLARQFSRWAEEAGKIPDRDELEALEETLKDLSRELENSQRSVRDKIQKEILPRIQEHLNRLRRELERDRRQHEIDPLDRRIEQMRTA